MKPLLLISLTLILQPPNFLYAQWADVSPGISNDMHMEDIEALNDSVVWAVTEFGQLGASGESLDFTRTVDGINWTAGTVNNSDATGNSFSNISPLSANDAWAAMFNVAGGGGIFHTADGGATWEHQITAEFAGPAGFPNVVHMFSPDSGFCMGDPNSGYFEIYTTSNGGNNWIRVPQVNIPANLSGEYGTVNVYWVMGSTIWFGTTLGRVFKSTDHGYTWEVHETGLAGITSIAFTDVNKGIAMTYGSFEITSDGGVTWNSISYSGTPRALGIEVIPGTHTIVTSESFVPGTSFTTDFGATWIDIDPTPMVCLSFINPTTGWGGGFNRSDPTKGIYQYLGPPLAVIHSAAVQSIEVPRALATSTIVTPMATVKNSDSTDLSFSVTLTITGGYSSTKNVTNLASGGTQQVTFDPWTASLGNFTVTVQSQLAGDVYPADDTLSQLVTVLEPFINFGWTSKAPYPEALWGGAVAAVNSDSSFLIVAGGATSVVLSDVNKFIPFSNSWQGLSDLPNAVYNVAGAYVNGNVYVVDGYAYDGTNFLNTDYNQAYDVSADEWNSGTPMPDFIQDYAMGVYKDSLIYYMGGYSDSIVADAVHIYNPFTDTWMLGSSLPEQISGCRGGIIGNKIVVSGGYSSAPGLSLPSAKTFVGTIDATDPTIISWAQAADYPTGIIFRPAAAASLDSSSGLIIFTGGEANFSGESFLGGASDYTFAFNINSNTWEIGPAKPTAANNVCNLTSIVFNDSLYMVAIGGLDSNYANLLDVNEWLNLGPYTFTGIQQINPQNVDITSYPNPFSKFITIKFNLDQPSFVKAIVVDVLGNEVAELCNKNLGADNHQLKWNAPGYTGGVYFCKLLVNDKRLTEKLVKF